MNAHVLVRGNFDTDLTIGKKSDWLYRLTKTAAIQIDGVDLPNCDVQIANGLSIASIHYNRIVAHPGYAWNGMSCWPDSPNTMMASLFHDLGYQLGKNPRNPLTRKQWDIVLRQLLKNNQYPCADVVYTGVRAFGGMFYGKGDDVRIL